ncbi:MAG: hypothetical protein AB8B87_01535 [Granulosicoccus sp.]
MKNLATSLTLVATLIAVAGCSSSSDSNTSEGGQPTNPSSPTTPTTPTTPTAGDNGTSGNVTGNVLQFGFFDIEDSSFADDVDISAGFFQFENALPAAQLTQILLTPEQERCIVSESDITDFDIDDLDIFPEIPFEYISAGDTIALSSVAGTYGELIETSLFGFTTYASESDLPFPVPSPLRIDITGAAFPAFSQVEIAAAPLLTGLNPGFGNPISAGTTVTWDTTNVDSANIALDASSQPINGVIVDIECIIDDDGSFTIPANTVAELDGLLGSNWTINLVNIERTNQVVRQSGNALLVVTRKTI